MAVPNPDETIPQRMERLADELKTAIAGGNIDAEINAVTDAVLTAIAHEMRGSYMKESLPDLYRAHPGGVRVSTPEEIDRFMEAVQRRTERIRTLLKVAGYEAPDVPEGIRVPTEEQSHDEEA